VNLYKFANVIKAFDDGVRETPFYAIHSEHVLLIGKPAFRGFDFKKANNLVRAHDYQIRRATLDAERDHQPSRFLASLSSISWMPDTAFRACEAKKAQHMRMQSCFRIHLACLAMPCLNEPIRSQPFLPRCAMPLKTCHGLDPPIQSLPALYACLTLPSRSGICLAATNKTPPALPSIRCTWHERAPTGFASPRHACPAAPCLAGPLRAHIRNATTRLSVPA
jgi:hypothetical protein